MIDTIHYPGEISMEHQEKADTPLRFLPLLIISCVLFSFLYIYFNQKVNEINRAIREHSRILVEPMWAYNTRVIDEVLATLIIRKDYEAIRIHDIDGSISNEALSPSQKGVSLFFTQLKLIPLQKFTSEIVKDGVYLGTLEVTWRNRMIYVSIYAILIAALFYIISILYNRITASNKILESNIKNLHIAMEEVRKQKEYIEHIFNVAPQGMIAINAAKEKVKCNTAFDTIIESWAEKLQQSSSEIYKLLFEELLTQLQQKEEGEFIVNIDGHPISLQYSSSEIPEFENIDLVVSLRDITDLASMQRRLAHAEKLESVGQLASGIAHEINTPTQYVSSNMSFLTESYRDISNSIEEIKTILNDQKQDIKTSLPKKIFDILEEADWDYLSEELPLALEQSTEGLRRIQSIVSAMKRFSHPSGDITQENDINAAIENTATVARNEWKYIAEMIFKLAPSLPKVHCYLDQLNQVILIMIVNAVHAIEEQTKDNPEVKGQITIQTRAEDDFVEISISDTGAGIPEEARKKIFDPFFTTKAVNKGSGQGLAIANDIIVNKHYGKIDVKSEVGKGTTFIIQIPRNL